MGTTIAVLGNALMFAIAFAVGLRPFAGRLVETPKHPHEAPVLLWLGKISFSLYLTHMVVLEAVVRLFDGRVEDHGVARLLGQHLGAAVRGRRKRSVHRIRVEPRCGDGLRIPVVDAVPRVGKRLEFGAVHDEVVIDRHGPGAQ